MVLLTLALLTGCFGPLCQVSTPITVLDGGSAVCLKAEDCPRPGDVFVCVTTAETKSKCVACVDTHCVTLTQDVCP